MAFFHKPIKSKTGSSVFLLVTIVGVLYIFGVMLINYMSQERTQSFRMGKNFQAYYLAEAAIEKGLIEFQQFVRQPLVCEDGILNQDLLTLMDPDRATSFSANFAIGKGELVEGGSAVVKITVRNVNLTPFGAYIDEYQDVPSLLDVFKKPDRQTPAERQLGGWEGILRLQAEGTYGQSNRRIEVLKELRVSDLTPPAEHYTLFVASNKEEYLREGEFRLRNWSVVRALHEKIVELAETTSTAFQDTMGGSTGDLFWEPNIAGSVSFEGEIRRRTLAVIRQLVMSVGDSEIRDFTDQIIHNLHPYLWGRIRTNGRLHVYLPFFAADDIINYFEDNTVFSHQRPEIGYLFCHNQLHDPYLSRYTYIEGEVIKYYKKLKPYVYGVTDTPYASSDAYTFFTKFNFVRENPNQLVPNNFARITDSARHYSHEFVETDLELEGTYTRPLRRNGLIYVQGNLSIGGRFSGRAMIVTEGDVVITQDIIHDSADSMLVIVALNGAVRFASGLDRARVESSIYAHNSIVGGEEIEIMGNLVVYNLNRQRGADGEIVMPQKVLVNYDSNLKSYTASNVCFNVSRRIATMRDM